MLFVMDQHPSTKIEVGEMVTVTTVTAANVVKDIRENLRNLVGGRLRHYEGLIGGAVETALRELDEKAQAMGYDGVVGVKIANPVVVEGAVEIIIYGNAFRFDNE